MMCLRFVRVRGVGARVACGVGARVVFEREVRNSHFHHS